jgi:hypothetical protein
MPVGLAPYSTPSGPSATPSPADLVHRRHVGAVAAGGPATVDRPDLAMRADFDPGGGAPILAVGQLRPLPLRRAERIGRPTGEEGICAAAVEARIINATAKQFFISGSARFF